MNSHRRKLLRLSVAVLTSSATIVLVVVGCAAAVHHGGVVRVYDDLARLPINDVGLVLGTSKESGAPGRPNPHLYNRSEAAAAL